MQHLPDMFGALSDPVRFAIVERLLDDGPQTAGSLGGVADISAPAISRHLKVLRKAGIVTREVAAQQRIYSVRPEVLRSIHAWVMDHRAFWEQGLDRLVAAIEEGTNDD